MGMLDDALKKHLLDRQASGAPVAINGQPVYEWIMGLGNELNKEFQKLGFIPFSPFEKCWIEFEGDEIRYGIFIQTIDHRNDSSRDYAFTQHIKLFATDNSRPKHERKHMPIEIRQARHVYYFDEKKNSIKWLATAERHATQIGDLSSTVRCAAMTAQAFGLFTLALMHCKNIELRDDTLPNPSQRKQTYHGIIYKTLTIDAFKKQVRSEREYGESEIKRALHICRGHFATYSEERPLFGKVSGTFWVPMHTRGSAEFGEVRKDYKVKAPA